MGAIYLDKFILPIEKEERIVKNKPYKHWR